MGTKAALGQHVWNVDCAGVSVSSNLNGHWVDISFENWTRSLRIVGSQSPWRILEPCDLDDGYLVDLLMRNTAFLRD